MDIAGDRDDSPSRVHIRPYRAADAQATLDVFVAAVTVTAAADYSPAQVAAWARPERRDVVAWSAARTATRTLVACVAEHVVGFADVDDNGYVDMMFVSPAHGRRGVAAMLLARLRTHGMEVGATELTANVSVTARPFFERHGFVVVTEQQPVVDGVVMTNYRMRLPLSVG